jgi:hypothetical protein
VNRPTPAQLETARRLLVYEGAAGVADECAATAAGRVYEKLHAHMVPLVSAAGFRLLFARSTRLTQGEFACFAESSRLDGSTELCACLQAQERAVAMAAATALFGTFIALLTTFIGERLTTQVLRSAWPTIEETPPTESET